MKYILPLGGLVFETAKGMYSLVDLYFSLSNIHDYFYSTKLIEEDLGIHIILKRF